MNPELHEVKHVFMSDVFVPVQMLEHQMDVREKEVQSLQSQALALSQEDAGLTEVHDQEQRVTDNFSNLQEPLRLRRQQLLASKEAHQFNRDLEDEIVSPIRFKVRQCSSVSMFYSFLCSSLSSG